MFLQKFIKKVMIIKCKSRSNSKDDLPKMANLYTQIIFILTIIILNEQQLSVEQTIDLPH